MAEIIVELFDGTRLSFPEGTDPAVYQKVAREQTKRLRADESAPAGSEVVETFADGGRIIRNTETGRESYVGDAYATSDPAQIARIRSRGGRANEMLKGQMAKDIIGEVPTRVASFFKGVPGFRGYVEPTIAAGAAGIASAVDAVQGALGSGGDAPASKAEIEWLLREAIAEREREAPGAVMASRLGAGLTSAYTAAPVFGALPVPQSLLGSSLVSGVYGATGGAIEGGIAGYGEGGVDEAKRQATIGAAFGAPLGLISPSVGAASGSLYRSYLERPVRRILDEIGFKGQAAQVVKDALARDAVDAVEGAEYMGPYGSVGTLGPNTEGLIDYVAQSSGEGATIVRRNLDETATAAVEDLNRVLDEQLGVPSLGLETQKKQIMSDTAQARRKLYGDAYDVEIVPGREADDALIDLLARTDDADLRGAQTLLREAGEPTEYLAPTKISEAKFNELPASQRSGLMVQSDADGGYIVQRIPTVADVDYITRRLYSRSEELMRSGDTAAALSKRNLSMQLRAALDNVSEPYALARAAGKDAIDQRAAADLGNDLLNPRVTREQVAMAMEGGMDDVMRKQLAQALRNRIDELAANAKGPRRTAAPIVEALAQLRAMNTRAVATKLRMALGDEVADAIGDQIRMTSAALENRALIASGSRTFMRQQIEERMAEIVGEPLAKKVGRQGVVPTITEGVLNVAGGPSQAQRIEAVGREIAPILTQRQTPEQLAQTAQLMQGLTPAIGRARESGSILDEMLRRSILSASAAGQGAGVAPQPGGVVGGLLGVR